MDNNRIEREKLALALKALGHPHRLQVYTRLVDCCTPGTPCCTDEGEMRACVGDLGSDLGIAPSTVSHHIRELYLAGLIHMERRGKNVGCWIVPEMLHMLTAFFGQLSSRVCEDCGTDQREEKAHE